jgi:predicted  nucleic acid-binding Zn-ribbon protein
VTNPKELGDIQEEIASLKRRSADLEDDLLEAMVNSEDAEAELNARRVALNDIDNQWQTDQKTLKGELIELETRLVNVREERDALRSTVAADDLALYDKVRDRLGSITVTTLRDGVCGFCAVAPSSTKLGRIRGGRELLLCGNCKRILLDI